MRALFNHRLFCRLCPLSLLYFVLAVNARAINPDPHTVSVGFSFVSTGAPSGSGTGLLTVYGNSTSSVGSSLGVGTNSVESASGIGWLKIGKSYTVNFLTYGCSPSEFKLGFVAPDGYSVLINNEPIDVYKQTVPPPLTSTCNYSYTIQVVSAQDAAGGPAGMFSGIRVGKAVAWDVGLGGLRSGKTAGGIQFREADLVTNAPASRSRLYYTPPRHYGQITVVKDGGSNQDLRQIMTPQVLVDLVDDAGGGYWLKFYQPSQGSWGGSSYSITGSPWKTIRVISPGASQLTITEAEGSASRVSTIALTSGSISSGTYVWTTQEGNGTTWLRTTTHTSTNNGNNTRDDVVAVRTGDANGTVVAKTRYRYETFSWGEELTQIVADPDSAALTTTYAYDTNSSSTNGGNYRRIKSVTSPTGNWTSYLYYNDWNRRGQLEVETRPYLDSPSTAQTASASVGFSTTYDYQADYTGRYRLPTSRQDYITNVQTGKRLTTPTLNQTQNSLNFTRYQANDYASATVTLQSTTEIIDPRNTNPDYDGLPLSVKRANQTQDSFAYHFGSYDYSTKTFTTPGNGSHFRTVVFHGSTSSSGADAVTSYDGSTVTTVYLVPNKSTREVIIRNPAGLVVRTETWVYTGTGSYTQLTSQDLSYDVAGRLTQSAGSNGAVVSNTYTDGFLTSTTGADGVQTDFTPDELWRVKTAKKIGVAASGSYAAQVDVTTTYTYDGADRITAQVVSATGTSETITTSTAYDLAGRVTSQTPPGLSATGVAYNASARTVTTTAPDGGTTINTAKLDGQAASVSGTAVVAQYLSYGVESDGRRYTRVDTGSSSSARWSKTWTDWLGRPTESRAPGFSITSQADFVTQHFYDGTTGALTKTTRTGYAPTLYEYNTLGEMVRSGLDVNNDGFLVLASMDRISDADASFENYASAWWAKQTSTVYPLNSSATAFTASIVRTRLTGFSGSLRAETQTTDAEGNTATSTTSVSGKIVTTTTTAPGMVNSATAVAYNGLAVGATGFDGLTNLTQYDALGRPWKSTDPRTLVTTTAYYTGTGLVQTVTDSASKVVNTITYDTSGRVLSQTDALGAVTRAAYNTRSAVIRQWGTGTNAVEYEYDATYGDRTKLRTWRTAPVDFSSATAFLPANYTYPATTGDVTTWNNDSATGLIWKKTDAAGKVVEFDYNVRRQVASRKWARKLTASGYTTIPVTSTYGYDSATGEHLTISYNDSVEPIPTPGVTYTYTRAGQLSTVADGAGSRSFAYQASSPWRLDYEALPAFFDSRRLTRLYETATGTTGSFGGYTKGTVKGRGIGFDLGISGNQARDLHQQYTASNLGRFVGVTGQAGAGTAQDFVYAYESGARLLDGYTAGSFSVSRDYESNRDLVSRIEGKWSTSSLTRFDFTYNDRYERVTARQNGTAFADYYTGTSYGAVYNVYGYNLRGELQTSAMYAGDTPSTAPSAADELPGRRFEYRYDDIGNRLTAGATGTNADDTFTPNALNQYSSRDNKAVTVLGTSSSASSVVINSAVAATKKDRAWAAQFAPANSGGAAQGSVTVNAASAGVVRSETRAWLMAQAVQTMTYDDDGNLLNDGMFAYTWNAENQLVRATSVLSSGVGFTRQRLDFKYDYSGRRIEKRVLNLDASAETLARRFIYDGWNLVVEIDANTPSTILRSYAWGLDLTGDLMASGGVGALLRMTNYASGSPGANYYPTYDGNGNVISLVNASSGAIAAVYEYDPFGNYLRNEVIDSAVADAPFRFSTKYTDSETGLSYFGLRFYSSNIGRFINRDPIEESGGINLYGFCGNDGINLYDYLGLDGDQKPPGWMPEWARQLVDYMTRTFGQWRYPGIQYDANLNNVWVSAYSDVTGQTNYHLAGQEFQQTQDKADKATYEQQKAQGTNNPIFQGTPGKINGTDSADVQLVLPAMKVNGRSKASNKSDAKVNDTRVAVIFNGSTFGQKTGERGLTSNGNPLGHIAIAIAGNGVFSFGNGYGKGSSFTKYVSDQAARRNSVIVVLNTNAKQHADILAALTGENRKMGITTDNCASITLDALAAGGLVLMVPQPTGGPGGIVFFTERPALPLPGEVLIGAGGVQSRLGGESYFVPRSQDYQPPSEFHAFNPIP